MAEIDNTTGLALSYRLAKVKGRAALAERLRLRLSTPYGKFFAWPDFGHDLRQYLLSKGPLSRMIIGAELECSKDEQVEAVTASAVYRNDGKAVDLTLAITDSEGPFLLTMSITQAAVDLVDLLEAA